MWEKLIDFFSSLLPDSWLQSLIDAFRRNLELRAPSAWARDLLATALIALLVGLAMDAWLYWTRKDRREILAHKLYRFLEFWHLFREMVVSIMPKRAQKDAEPAQDEPSDPESAILREDQLRELDAFDRQLRQTEDTLDRMQEDLRQAASATPTVQEDTAESQPEPAAQELDDVPDETEPVPPEGDAAASPDAIHTDTSGFSAPRRARRGSSGGNQA